MPHKAVEPSLGFRPLLDDRDVPVFQRLEVHLLPGFTPSASRTAFGIVICPLAVTVAAAITASGVRNKFHCSLHNTAARHLHPRPTAPILSVPATAMAINGHRNKPIGPGGSTRRLHHLRPAQTERSHWGRNRIDKGVKGVFLLGEVPPLSVQKLIVANDNHKAPVALAA